jgi:hypothetical protein
MDELCSLARMANHLRVTQSWLKKQADSGRVPCLKAGKQLLFNPTAVIQTLARRAGHPVFVIDPSKFCRADRSEVQRDA